MKVDSRTFFKLMAAAVYVFGDGDDVDIEEMLSYVRQEAELKLRTEKTP